MRIALLSYSTKPRGGVVHTLALAEALAAAGADVTVWSLGRGGDTAFYRAVDPRVTLVGGALSRGARRSRSGRGSCARSPYCVTPSTQPATT